MPLPGGSSAKAGLRYELLWTVNCMLRVMQEETMSIELERPGQEGEGIEFTIETSDSLEHHQVKRQLTGKRLLVACVFGKRGCVTPLLPEAE